MPIAGKTANLSAPGAAAPSGEAAAPGKRTLVEQRLAAEVHQQVAERCDAGGEGCFLDPTDRERVMDELRTNAMGAAQNWGAALADARLARLVQHEGGWNALWEIGFYLAMGGVSSGLVAGMAALKGAVHTLEAYRRIRPIVARTGEIQHALMFAMKGARINTRVLVNAAASAGARGEAAFLQTMRSAPVDWSVGLIRQAKDLDDASLITLVGAIDPLTVLTYDHFQAEISGLVARWHDQVQMIGARGQREGETESCAWVTPRDGGDARLARVVRATPDGRSPNTAVRFHGWVDAALVPDAIAAWERASPGQGVEIVTLGQLADVPADAYAWERHAAPGITAASADIEPHREASHEDPRR